MSANVRVAPSCTLFFTAHRAALATTHVTTELAPEWSTLVASDLAAVVALPDGALVIVAGAHATADNDNQQHVRCRQLLPHRAAHGPAESPALRATIIAALGAAIAAAIEATVHAAFDAADASGERDVRDATLTVLQSVRIVSTS